MRRANLVRARLIALGVAPSRLIAQTANGTRPVIEFVILSRAGEP